MPHLCLKIRITTPSRITSPSQNLHPANIVRKRPGMYIGGTDSRALHHMVWAGMDYMVEEAEEGYCDHI